MLGKVLEEGRLRVWGNRDGKRARERKQEGKRGREEEEWRPIPSTLMEDLGPG